MRFKGTPKPHLRDPGGVLLHTPDFWSLRHWVGQAALRIDDGLRRRNNVCEYTNDPKCVFRIQITEAGQDIDLADGAAVHKGDRLISLHLWNEHVPAIPPEGPSFAWGRRMGRAMDVSLRQLAAFMSVSPEFDSVVAIRGNMAESTFQTAAQLLRIMQHFGFESIAQEPALPWRHRLHQFGENLLVLLLLLAVNPMAARTNVLSRVRFDVLLSRQSFTRRYGPSALADGTHMCGEPCDENRAPGIARAAVFDDLRLSGSIHQGANAMNETWTNPPD